MQTPLSAELYWLVLTIAMTAGMWIPYIVNRMAEQGVLSALWDPFGHTEAKAAWANRMMQAHINAVENLVIFAPLVILVQITARNTTLTANVCAVYFIARLVHYLGFTFAIPLLRVVSFLVGFAVQLFLLLAVLKPV